MKVRWLLFSETLTRPWEGKKRRSGLFHDHILEQLKNIAKPLRVQDNQKFDTDVNSNRNKDGLN